MLYFKKLNLKPDIKKKNKKIKIPKNPKTRKPKKKDQ